MGLQKKTKKGMMLPLTLGACMTTVLVGCSGSSGGGGGSTSNAPQLQEAREGSYKAVLTPVNPTVAPTAAGEVTVRMVGDDFSVDVNVTGASTTTHYQHIHVGTSCPSLANDTNADGVVDATEAATATGNMLIPLDSDLSAQLLGNGNHPSSASYNYSESASYAVMLADLILPDLDTSDSLDKLPSDTTQLALGGRVVEIHGVPSGVTLPATAAGVDGMSAHASLPILCGVLTYVEEEEGTTAGTTSGTTSGTTAGTTSGTTSGTTAGTTSGTTSGTTAGTTSGTTSGTTAGTTSGTTSGTTAGTTGN